MVDKLGAPALLAICVAYADEGAVVRAFVQVTFVFSADAFHVGVVADVLAGFVGDDGYQAHLWLLVLCLDGLIGVGIVGSVR